MANNNTTALLTQTKLYTGPESAPTLYVVQNLVTAAYPASLAAPFLIQPAGPPYYESLVRVATAADLLMGYSVAPLVEFDSPYDPMSLDFTQNPVLQLFNIPAEWGIAPDGTAVDPGTGALATPYKGFPIVSLGALVGPRISMVVGVPFWSMYQPNPTGFSFAITDDLNPLSAPLASGANGLLHRLNDTSGLTVPYLCDRWQSVYLTAQEAFNGILAIQTALNGLIEAVAADGNNYLDAQPGNPIMNTYSA